jgi:hypothetical protein
MKDEKPVGVGALIVRGALVRQSVLLGVDARQISSDGLNGGAWAQKIARPHPSLLPQEKVQKKSVVRPSGVGGGNFALKSWGEK